MDEHQTSKDLSTMRHVSLLIPSISAIADVHQRPSFVLSAKVIRFSGRPVKVYEPGLRHLAGLSV